MKQEVAVVDSADILAAAVSLLHDALSTSDTAKVIVFLPTARETGLFAELVKSLYFLADAPLLITVLSL